MATGVDVASVALLVGGVIYVGYRVARWCTRIRPPFAGAVLAFIGTQVLASLFVFIFGLIFLSMFGDQASGHGMWLAYFVTPAIFLVSIFAALFAGLEDGADSQKAAQSTDGKSDAGKDESGAKPG